MKRSLLLLFLSIGIFSLVTGQGVPNGDFELWEDMISYMAPTGWDSPNTETSIVGIVTVTQETVDVFEGTYSARLETKDVLGKFQAPGLLTLGQFSVDFITTEFTIEGGIPFTATPDKLVGDFKYTSVNNDTWFITTLFTRWNPSTMQRDTVGGSTYDGTATDEWTHFESDILFWAGVDPDTMNIILVSSDILNAQVGSVLLIDGLAFENGVGFEETALENNVNIFLNQRDNQLKLQYNFETPRNVEVRVYNVMGQQMMIAPELSVQNYTQTVHLHGLESGMYMVEVNDGKEKFVKKIIL